MNLYFERDSSGKSLSSSFTKASTNRDLIVDPNDASCSNPASVTMIKCVYWASAVSQDTAVNSGQYRNQFQVVIAGSNGYVSNQIATPAGYQAGTPYGKFAINAPYDAQGYNTFMGSKIFTTTWDVNSCAKYCDAQTAYNKATAPKDGTPYKVCNFFNTYVLTAHKADGSVVPQGQYCALYTEAWSSQYAVNAGSWRGKDQYLVSYSFGYPKLNPGIAPTAGDVTGAVYQARQDMTYSPSSLTSVFQPFCSSLLGYMAPTASVTALTTTTPVSVTTVVSISTVAANAKRAAASSSPTPAVLTKYPTAVISSACSLIVSSPTMTSTVTVATSTITAAASISTSTSVSTVTSAPAVATPPTVLSARFGDQDVTNAAKAAFMQNGNIVIDLSNTAGPLGGDPRWLTTKTLDVLYSVNGQMYVFTGYDFEGVYTITTTSQPNSEPVAGVNAPTGGGGCDIIAIAYGNGQAPKTTDSGNVYNTFKAACDNAASYTVSYNDFGFDNMVGKVKTAVFWYYQNGVLTSKAAWEDENNVISFAPTAKPQAPTPPNGNYCQGKPSFFLQATGPGTNVDQQFGWVSGGVNIYFQQQSSSSATVMCFDANNHVYAGWNGHVLARHTDPSDYFIGFVPQSDAGSYDIATCGIVDGHFWCDGDERNINQVNSNQEWFSGTGVSSGNSAIMIYAYTM